MSGRIGTAMGRASAVVSPGLKHISAGWTDTEMLTVRKMAAAGATADDIGAACGRTANWAVGFIRRNRLVWNKKSIERHVVLSASAIGAHEARGNALWAKEGRELREAGFTIAEIAAYFGISLSAAQQYFRRHGIRPLKGGAR